MLFASLILGILSVTDVQQHEVHVPKTHRWWSPLFVLMRSLGPGRCLIVFYGFMQCCNVTNSVVPFFPFHGCFGRCYKSGATSLVLQQQLSQFLHIFTQPSSRTFWLMALSVNSVWDQGWVCVRARVCACMCVYDQCLVHAFVHPHWLFDEGKVLVCNHSNKSLSSWESLGPIDGFQSEEIKISSQENLKGNWSLKGEGVRT